MSGTSRRIVSVVMAAALLLGHGPVSAHSGGTDANGCHAGSRPYHCHGSSGLGGSSGSESSSSGTTPDVVGVTVSPTTQSVLGTVGVSISPTARFQTTGIGSPTFSIVPTLVAGLSFDPTTGVISGIPAAVSAGVFYTVAVTDGIRTATALVTISIAAAATTTSTTQAPQPTIDIKAATRDRLNGVRCVKQTSTIIVESVIFKCVRKNKRLVWQSQS
jgi:hypothetical protein